MPKREFTVAGEYHYRRSGPVRWVASHLLRYKHFLGSWLVAGIAAWLLAGSIPVLTGRAFGVITGPHPDGQQLGIIALLALGAVIIQGTLDLVARLSSELLAQRIQRDSRDELYLNLLGKSQTFHNRQQVGDIMARANNDVRMLDFMMSPGFDLILDSFSGLVIALIYIGFVNVQLLLTPVLFTVVFGISLWQYNKRLNAVSTQMREQFGVLNAGLEESITGIEVVKSAAQEVQEKRKFAQNATRYRDFFIASGRIQARYIPPLLLAVAYVGAFLHGVILYRQGVISLGAFVTFMGLIGLLRFPTNISIFSFNLAQMGFASAKRILDIMREETEMDENTGGRQEVMQGDITFEHVSFGYGDHLILKDISFHAAPGQTVAIVGQTGSGKTTLTKLVNRTYDAQAGRVLVDGVDVREWSLDGLRSQISTIEQDIFLFSRSIAENIAFSEGQEASHDEIERAARDAQAHDFITSFKDGYATVIGERGATLSGGQRQRLAIARALLTDPHILILDDSTSAIDSATEDEIQRAIRRVLQGRTTLLITHRLSQIRWADKILVLDQGTLIDQGTHEELLARCALYQRIFARHGRERVGGGAYDHSTTGH